MANHRIDRNQLGIYTLVIFLHSYGSSVSLMVGQNLVA
jgi:hypothetical protein